MKQRVFALADRFLPPGSADSDDVRRGRAAVFQSWLGTLFTGTFAALYAYLGSAWSGAAIGLITLCLVCVPWWVRRGLSVCWIGNALIGQTWLATLVVVTRSGGFTSPALVWNFLLPLCIYSVAGHRAATFWAVAAGAQIGLFYVAELSGESFAQDFEPAALSLLRISGFVGTIVATITVLLAFESARAASLVAREAEQRALDRQRILDDMHDGVGSQLLGLIVRSRSGTLPKTELVAGLESCLDDLRLIVDSLELLDQSLESALGALRARVEARCQACGIALHWQSAGEIATELSAEGKLQVLRALQELLNNALRHASTSRIDVLIGPAPRLPDWVEVAVRDYGVGFDPVAAPRHGRGMKSLKTRGRKLGGLVSFQPAAPGTLAVLRFPRRLPSTGGSAERGGHLPPMPPLASFSAPQKQTR
jgi:signal transduction histidine kinase